ncbi:hypothetical protein M0813_15344 [Anaeramoeba flamelloides]|uniref:Uncharacterized protein n=1 Tax=Anaeramoeba flamelloides TaxID=1746091 RepID=A0ABQ8Z2L0_9EUKA|nr:hypothetical protein M0813_15344 [Anaeramoeba flamelloides]
MTKLAIENLMFGMFKKEFGRWNQKNQKQPKEPKTKIQKNKDQKKNKEKVTISFRGNCSDLWVTNCEFKQFDDENSYTHDLQIL